MLPQKLEHGKYLYVWLSIIILMSGACAIAPLVCHAQGSLQAPDTIILIDSSFKLWGYEKALDKNFTIHIWIPGASFNSSNNYTIRVDNNITSGVMGNSLSKSYLVNVTRLQLIEVIVNNQSRLLASNIRIMTGVTQTQIDNGASPFTINLLPSQWKSKEWNIFYAMLTSAIICSFIAYRLVTSYRKARGVQEIQ